MSVAEANRPADLPALISVNEAMRQLGVSKPTMYARVFDHVRSVRIGKRRMIYVEDLLAYMEGHTQGKGPAPTSEPACAEVPDPHRQGRPRKSPA